MDVIYDSECFYVVEYAAERGYELVDKHTRRGTFLQGHIADRFAQSLRDVVGREDASVECVDEFLDDFSAFMVQSVLYH